MKTLLALLLLTLLLALPLKNALSREFEALIVNNTSLTLKPRISKAVPSQVASWYNFDLPGLPDYGKSHRTAASRDYPRGTMLRVVNIANGKSVDVLVNDWVENPKVAIDLSSYAFSQLAPLKLGLIKVDIEKL